MSRDPSTPPHRFVVASGQAEKMTETKIIKIVDKIILSGIENNASSIHIELTLDNIVVRNRIDGKLKKVDEHELKHSTEITKYIKTLAKLKASKKIPQEGRFKIENKKYKISFRVSIMPVVDGEKIVLHINNELEKKTKLEELDLEKEDLKILKKNIKKSSGIILINGDKKSGKIETIYTLLNELSNTNPASTQRGKKEIATIENPIEYKLPKIKQTQINPKIDYTFATGLKTLNKISDIIYINDAKNKKTFFEFFKSTLNGHLIFSSLPFSSTKETLNFLYKLNVDPFLLSSNLNLIISQTMLPQICPHCRKEIKTTVSQNKKLKKHFDNIVFKKYLVNNKIIKTVKSPIKFYKSKGCRKCDNSGYFGRVPIYEFFEINDKVANLIKKKTPINKILKQNPNISLAQKGFIKAMQGFVNIEDVMELI